jgi:Domain of unknown function (DUF4123)
MNRFALVDSAQAEGFYRDMEREHLPYASLFEGHAEHSLIEIAPLLVKLPDEGTASRFTIVLLRRIDQLGAAFPCLRRHVKIT